MPIERILPFPSCLASVPAACLWLPYIMEQCSKPYFQGPSLICRMLKGVEQMPIYIINMLSFLFASYTLLKLRRKMLEQTKLLQKRYSSSRAWRKNYLLELIANTLHGNLSKQI